MVMRLDKVVPFGRTFDEYRLIFSLTEADLRRRILGVGDGPASFNAEMHERGGDVTSIDPLYVFSAEEIDRRFRDCVDNVIGQVKATPANWVWKFHRSADDLRENRTRAMNRFAAHFAQKQNANRYVTGQLPRLPFADNSFDLALCSHFLFLYSEQFDEQFHVDSVHEMLRVAPEVRVFPLLTLLQVESPHLAAVMRSLEAVGVNSEVVPVEYELQPGGNKMLRMWR